MFRELWAERTATTVVAHPKSSSKGLIQFPLYFNYQLYFILQTTFSVHDFYSCATVISAFHPYAENPTVFQRCSVLAFYRFAPCVKGALEYLNPNLADDIALKSQLLPLMRSYAGKLRVKAKE